MTESSARDSDDDAVGWGAAAHEPNILDPRGGGPPTDETGELSFVPDLGHVDCSWDIGSSEPFRHDDDDDEDDPYDDDEDDDFFPDDSDEDFDDDDEDDDLDDEFEDVIRLSV